MSSLSQLDDLKDRYTIAWQVPGLPQLLMLSNVSGKLFQKHKQEHPEGYTRPWEVVGNNREAHPERAHLILLRQNRGSKKRTDVGHVSQGV